MNEVVTSSNAFSKFSRCKGSRFIAAKRLLRNGFPTSLSNGTQEEHNEKHCGYEKTTAISLRTMALQKMSAFGRVKGRLSHILISLWYFVRLLRCTFFQKPQRFQAPVAVDASGKIAVVTGGEYLTKYIAPYELVLNGQVRMH